MPNIFSAIDAFMFRRLFQPLVNRFPEAGPAGVARFFLTGWVVSLAFDIMLRPMPLPFRAAILILSVPSFWSLYRNADYGTAPVGLRNPLRVDPIYTAARAGSWALLAAAVMRCGGYTAMWAALGVAYCYAVACDKMPPALHRRYGNGWRGPLPHPAR